MIFRIPRFFGGIEEKGMLNDPGLCGGIEQKGRGFLHNRMKKSVFCATPPSTSLTRNGVFIMKAQKFVWSEMPADPVREGFAWQFAIGENMMIIRQTIQPGAVIAEHSHVHEQIVHLFQGKLRLTVTGESITLGPGESLLIPPNAPHAVEVEGDEEVVVFDIFSPVREELLKRNG